MRVGTAGNTAVRASVEKKMPVSACRCARLPLQLLVLPAAAHSPVASYALVANGPMKVFCARPQPLSIVPGRLGATSTKLPPLGTTIAAPTTSVFGGM